MKTLNEMKKVELIEYAEVIGAPIKKAWKKELIIKEIEKTEAWLNEKQEQDVAEEIVDSFENLHGCCEYCFYGIEGQCTCTNEEYKKAEALANQWVTVELKYGIVHGQVVDVDGANVYVVTMTEGRYKFHHSECTIIPETKPHNTRLEVLEKIDWTDKRTVLHADVMELIEGRGQVSEPIKQYAPADFTEWNQSNIDWLIDWLGNALEYKQCVIYEKSQNMIELWCDAEDNDGDYYDIEIIIGDDCMVRVYDRLEGTFKFEEVVKYPLDKFLEWAV